MKTITPARIESWTHSAPMDWANESFAIANRRERSTCIRQGASRDQPAGKVKIDAAYVAANTPIVREQLQKAGVRLAHLLDAAFAQVATSRAGRSGRRGSYWSGPRTTYTASKWLPQPKRNKRQTRESRFVYRN